VVHAFLNVMHYTCITDKICQFYVNIPAHVCPIILKNFRFYYIQIIAIEVIPEDYLIWFNMN